MDWKEKGIETIFVGAIAFMGTLIVKKIKPVWKWAIGFFTVVQKAAYLEKTIEENKVKIAVLESTQEALMQTAPDGIYIMNLEGELIYANNILAEMMGFSNIEDAYGKGYMQAIPEKDIERAERITERLTEHPSSFQGEATIMNVKTKEFFRVFSRSELIFDNKGILVKRLGRVTIISN